MHSEANRRITCCAKAAVATVLPKKDVLADALKNNKKNAEVTYIQISDVVFIQLAI